MRYRQEIERALAQWCEEAPRWGRTDCALALANIDRAVLGVDTGKGWRGRYYTQRTAMRLMGKGGILRVAVRVARRFKWTPIGEADMSKAQDGDRGIALTRGALAWVIRYRGFWVGRHHGAGHVLAGDREILRAWSIC